MLPFVARSQNCERLTVTDTDKVSKKITTSLTNTITRVSESGSIDFYMDVRRTNDGYTVLYIKIKDPGIGCINEDGYFYLLFTDGTSETFYNEAFNCMGVVTGWIEKNFKSDKEYITALSEKTIRAIKVESNNSYYAIAVNKVQAENFRRSASCLFNQ